MTTNSIHGKTNKTGKQPTDETNKQNKSILTKQNKGEKVQLKN
jgi:hypothetical protein